MPLKNAGKAHGNHPLLHTPFPGMLLDQWLLLTEPLVWGFSLSSLPQDHFPTKQLHTTHAVPFLSLPYVPEECDSDIAMSQLSLMTHMQCRYSQ